MYKRILVPYDGSPTSRLGLVEAIRLAKDQGAQLRLLNVVEEYVLLQSSSLDGSGLYAGDLLKVMTAESKKIVLQGLALAQRSGVDAQAETLESFAERSSDCIVDAAKKWRADLIVMGTHGRRGISRLVLGSDAEIVVRSAPVPVLLVRSPEPKAKAKKA